MLAGQGANYFSVKENCLATEEGLADLAVEGSADVGAEFMPVEEILFFQLEAGGDVDEGEVRVHAGGDVAFVLDVEALGGIALVMAETKVSGRAGPRERRMESALDAGDSAPDFEEVLVGLHVGRRRGMVGANDGDFAVGEVLPEFVIFGGGSEWGSCHLAEGPRRWRSELLRIK